MNTLLHLLVGAALTTHAGRAFATITSDDAWARFRGARELADGGREVDHFNRFVFAAYQNLAVFAGPGDPAGSVLTDFKRAFPNTRVYGGPSALNDLDRVATQVDPSELSLIVVDERFLGRGDELAQALARVDDLNRAGNVVKIILAVHDDGVILPTTAVRNGALFDFGNDRAAALKRAVDDGGVRPARAKSWFNLTARYDGRDRMVMLKMVALMLSAQKHVGVLAGTAADTDRLVVGLANLPGVRVSRRRRGSVLNLIPPGGFDPVGLNLVRLPVEADNDGQWPPAYEFYRLLHEVNMANTNGARVKLLVESPAPFEVPAAVRSSTDVIATSRGCDAYLKSTKP